LCRFLPAGLAVLIGLLPFGDDGGSEENITYFLVDLPPVRADASVYVKHQILGWHANDMDLALHNFCIRLNDQLGRPRLKFADLMGW
jgi:hypothetical protein